jgi:hypothetical protein
MASSSSVKGRRHSSLEPTSTQRATSNNGVEKWYHLLRLPWDSLDKKQKRKLESNFFKIMLEEYAAQNAKKRCLQDSSSSPCRVRICRLFRPDYCVVGVQDKYISGLAEIIKESGGGPVRIAAFHARDISLFGHAGDFSDFVRRGDVVEADLVPAETGAMRDSGLSLYLGGRIFIGEDDSDSSGSLLAWLQERDLEFVDFVGRLSSERRNPDIVKEHLLSGMISCVRERELDIALTSEGPLLGESATCGRGQLFAGGVALSGAGDLRRVFRTGESISCKVEQAGKRELTVTLATIGPEDPSGVEYWLKQKKVDVEDFIDCLKTDSGESLLERASRIQASDDPRICGLLKTGDDFIVAAQLVKVLSAALLGANDGRGVPDPERVLINLLDKHGERRQQRRHSRDSRDSDVIVIEKEANRHSQEKTVGESVGKDSPLHLLCQYSRTDKKFWFDGDLLRFEDEHIFPMDTLTSFQADPSYGAESAEFYTLGTLAFFLLNAKFMDHAQYIRAALRDNQSTVRKSDRDRVFDYFSKREMEEEERSVKTPNCRMNPKSNSSNSVDDRSATQDNELNSNGALEVKNRLSDSDQVSLKRSDTVPVGESVHSDAASLEHSSYDAANYYKGGKKRQKLRDEDGGTGEVWRNPSPQRCDSTGGEASASSSNARSTFIVPEDEESFREFLRSKEGRKVTGFSSSFSSQGGM